MSFGCAYCITCTQVSWVIVYWPLNPAMHVSALHKTLYRCFLNFKAHLCWVSRVVHMCDALGNVKCKPLWLCKNQHCREFCMPLHILKLHICNCIYSR
jgi:hypothetical protein